MSYHHGSERKKFENRQRALRRNYQQAGMAEADIQALYQFDLAAFNSERRHREHTQELPENPILPINPEETRFWWVEEIEAPVLVSWLKSMPQADLELLTLYAVDGVPLTAIAAMRGVSKQAVSQKIDRLKKISKKTE